MSDNGWREYQRYVLAELRRLSVAVEDMRNTLDSARLDIASLKVKASFWGAVSGCIVMGGIEMVRKIL